MAKLKRPSMLLFLSVPDEGGSTSKFRLAGIYSDDITFNYNPKTEESQDVTEVASTTDVVGYGLSIPVVTKVVAKAGDKGYEVSAYIQKLRRKLATVGDAETDAIIVDTYEGSEGSFTAQKFKGVIQIDTYGGPASESLGISYTVYANGAPVDGTVAITTTDNGDMTAEFTKSVT